MDTLDKPTLVLAPIRGVTNAAFREHFARCFGGFHAAVAPYVVVERGKVPPVSRLRDAFASQSPSLPTVPQVLTDDPDGFVAVARIFFAEGSTQVNWNLGCPYPMVTRRGRGAGLLAHPERIEDFLDRACSALGPHVSVKLRLGLDDAAQVGPVLEVLDRFPLSEVTIHPRTANQMYRGNADVQAFARCVCRCRHPLTYNGDIVDAAGFRKRIAMLPSVRRWMIGRGALANPFLPAALSLAAQRPQFDLAALEQFHGALLDHYRTTLSGPSHVLHKMKALWGYLSRSFDPKAKSVKKLQRAKHLDVHLRYAREVFDGAARWIA